MLNLKDYAFATATIFTLVFLLHGLRIFMNWEAVIGGWAVPVWASWIALVVSGYLAYCGFSAGGHLGKR